MGMQTSKMKQPINLHHLASSRANHWTSFIGASFAGARSSQDGFHLIAPTAAAAATALSGRFRRTQAAGSVAPVIDSLRLYLPTETESWLRWIASYDLAEQTARLGVESGARHCAIGAIHHPPIVRLGQTNERTLVCAPSSAYHTPFRS